MALPISITSAPSAEERSQTERCTGRLLGKLGPQGYVVLGDGVVVGPTGVVVVTILTCTERLRIHHGELWHGRFSRRHDLARAQRKLLEVARLVDRVDPDIPVRSMVCVVGVPVPDDPYCVLDVELSDPSELPVRIQDGPLRYQDLRDGIRRALLRRFPYAVYFAIEREFVVVVAVLRASRDPEEWQRRRG